jgi:hypothetical protein
MKVSVNGLIVGKALASGCLFRLCRRLIVFAWRLVRETATKNLGYVRRYAPKLLIGSSGLG